MMKIKSFLHRISSILCTATFLLFLSLSGGGCSSFKAVTITPTGDGKESITPDMPQIIAQGSTQSFTVIPNSG